MASRLNNQFPQFIARSRDPCAIGADALVLLWHQFQLPYIFPPLPLLPRFIKKIGAEGRPCPPSGKPHNTHGLVSPNDWLGEKDFTGYGAHIAIYCVGCVMSKMISLDAWHVSMIDNKITKVNKSALYFCGFPTLKHIRHTFSLKKAGVQVFQQSSRGENMILEIVVDEDSEDNEVEIVASAVLGKSVFVNWPHLEEARVVSVSDGEAKFYLDEPQGTQKLYVGGAIPPATVINVGNKERNIWVKEVQGIHEHYHKRKGVIVNDTSVIIYAQLLTGRRYQLSQNGDVVLEKQWSKQVVPFVYQAVVKDITAFESGSSHFKTLGELFSTGSTVFMLGIPYYGCMGEVQDSSDVLSENRIRVLFSITYEPELDALILNQHGRPSIPEPQSDDKKRMS
ncbi:unnamed protein product, partial [Ranitomeya imitator]